MIKWYTGVKMEEKFSIPGKYLESTRKSTSDLKFVRPFIICLVKTAGLLTTISWHQKVKI